MQNECVADDSRSEILEALPFLRGQSFALKAYGAYRPGWEHDHCAVCSVKFTEPGVEGDDVLQRAMQSHHATSTAKTMNGSVLSASPRQKT